jgi:hypothetical protein
MKLSPETKATKQENAEEKRAVYETPAIVYEGLISTRAGSPLIVPDDGEGIDPSDLFGS